MAEAKWVSDLSTKRSVFGLDEGISRDATLVSSFQNAVVERGDEVVFVEADDTPVTTQAFYQLSRRIAKGLIANGVARQDGVGIIGYNHVRWFATDWGCILAGALPAPSYQTNSPEIVSYICDHASAKMFFVDDDDALGKVIAARALSDKGTLEHIVVWGDSVDLSKYMDHSSYIMSWEEFLSTGDTIDDAILDSRMSEAKPEDCAKLIYTSGTTGPPKAVMISHDNLVWVAQMLLRDYKIEKGEILLSYLPTSHIASNAVDCVAPVLVGLKMHIAKPGALKGTLVDCLKRVRPTVFFAVPRVWEKIMEKMLSLRKDMGWAKLAISNWAKATGLRMMDAQDEGRGLPFGSRLANALVYSSIKSRLGLDRARILVNTAAPLQMSTNLYFRSLSMRILDVYGMSEASGPLVVTTPWTFKLGSSGKPLTGLEVKVVNKDNNGDGELCFRGRNIFMGYLSDATETAVATDEEGYIHTGDVGRVDEEGYIFITGRVKEIIVTAGGENVAPALIESDLLMAMPAIARAFIVGDKRKYIGCLLIPAIDENGNLINHAANVSSSCKTAQDTVNNAEWDTYIKNGIEKANENAISNVAKVKNYRVLTEDFSVTPREGYEKGELTPTLKVRRKVVLANYEKVIDEMYGDS